MDSIKRQWNISNFVFIVRAFLVVVGLVIILELYYNSSKATSDSIDVKQ